MKRIAFGGLLLILVILVLATGLEKIWGTEFVCRYIYASFWMILLWGIVVGAGVCYLLRHVPRKAWATRLLHLAFVVILAGALTTHLWGKQGTVHLREGEEMTTRYLLADATEAQFPFGMQLKSFELEYYTGSTAPMDYVSILCFADGCERRVSMNHIVTYRGYRFYQSGYDKDGKGTLLSVAHDPYGISITYVGYLLLFHALMFFFVQRQSRFRTLLRSPIWRRGLTMGLLLTTCICVQATDRPRALPQPTAEVFGRLYVYWGDRICPLQTLARDFTIKLYGKDSYRGLTAEQVLTGWFFYYDDWKHEPMIKVKDKHTRRVLGIQGGYACLTDFTGRGVHKIDEALQHAADPGNRQALEAANEKFSLISMLCTGALLRLYPYVEDSTVRWYSLADKLPQEMPADEWRFIRSSMDYVAEQVALKCFPEVEQLLGKIRRYQEKGAGEVLPSESRFSAERLYNKTNFNRPLAMACAALGILSFIGMCVCLVRGSGDRGVSRVLTVLMLLVFLYLSVRIALRGYVSGHVPLSNGFETMQFLAWTCALFTLLMGHRFRPALSFGFLLVGLSMLVSMFGESNPKITLLMPVLQSPLLSIHVVAIMMAYALLAFVMMSGVTALVLHHTHRPQAADKVEYLGILSRLMLYPAVFLLTVGIFIGAVWANVSWGRYWGWDAKEVWALITLLTYALALHEGSLPAFRRPLFFHIYTVVAFLTVLITYFGVNFFLGGRHAYA